MRVLASEADVEEFISASVSGSYSSLTSNLTGRASYSKLQLSSSEFLCVFCLDHLRGGYQLSAHDLLDRKALRLSTSDFWSTYGDHFGATVWLGKGYLLVLRMRMESRSFSEAMKATFHGDWDGGAGSRGEMKAAASRHLSEGMDRKTVSKSMVLFPDCLIF